ncbi:uncharacterized protein WM294_006483 [Sarcoramphus papa]
MNFPNSALVADQAGNFQIEDARTVNVPKGLRPQHYQHQHQSLRLCLHLPCILHRPMHFLFHPGYHHHRFLLSFHLVSLHLLGTLSPLHDIPQLLQTGGPSRCAALADAKDAGQPA